MAEEAMDHVVVENLASAQLEALGEELRLIAAHNEERRCLPGERHRPSDDDDFDEEEGDIATCKDCGKLLTWDGPSHLDWYLAEEQV